MTHPVSGNPTWQDYPNTSTPITAAALEAMETALDRTPVEAGSSASTLNTGAISLSSTAPNAYDHAFTTARSGRILARQNTQFTPLTGQGTANRTTVSPVLVGIEVVRASDNVVLASDRDWSEGFCLDSGYGLYGLCNLGAEILTGTLPAGNYLARALVFSVQATGTPRVSLQRLKTKWQVIR